MCVAHSAAEKTLDSSSTCERLEANEQAADVTNDHNEDVTELSKPQPNATVVQFPSSESEATSLDQPSGQTDSLQTVPTPLAVSTAHIPATGEIVGRHFVHVIDIDTDEGDSPNLSSNKGSVVSDKQSFQGQIDADQEGARKGEEGGSNGQAGGISDGSGVEQRQGEEGDIDDGREHLQHIEHTPDTLNERYVHIHNTTYVHDCQYGLGSCGCIVWICPS